VYIPKLEIQQYNTSDALKAFRSVSVLDWTLLEHGMLYKHQMWR
jgi:hypothetical protein